MRTALLLAAFTGAIIIPSAICATLHVWLLYPRSFAVLAHEVAPSVFSGRYQGICYLTNPPICEP